MIPTDTTTRRREPQPDESMTTKPKDLLEPSDYSNYRNIRAVSRLFVFLGSILVMGGVLAPLLENENSQEKIHPAFAVGIVLVGLAGAIGGMAALRRQPTVGIAGKGNGHSLLLRLPARNDPELRPAHGIAPLPRQHGTTSG